MLPKLSKPSRAAIPAVLGDSTDVILKLANRTRKFVAGDGDARDQTSSREVHDLLPRISRNTQHGEPPSDLVRA